jgi:hypothetical protein
MQRLKIGILLAAAGGAALIVLAPWRHVDQDAAGRIHLALGRDVVPIVAVAIDGADPGRLARIAAEGGARAVRGAQELPPAVAPSGAPGDVRELDGTALLDGSVPLSVLRDTIVVLDSRDRARARADALARVALPEPGPTGRAAAVLTAALASALIAWAAARARLRKALAILALAALAAATATAGAAALGFTLPAVELGLLAPVGLAGAFVDNTLELRRAVAELAPPLLRSAARTATATAVGGTAAIAEPLAEILQARALLLLQAGPGERWARPLGGFQLRAADLRPTALDTRRAPYGLSHSTDGTALLDSGAPARLFTLSFAGLTEGYLLAVGERVATEARPAVAAAIGALARDLRQGRLGARATDLGRQARLLVDAAHAMERGTLSLHAALASAGTGLLLAAPDGSTLWKNERFGEGLPEAASDLARALAAAMAPGESMADVMDRVVSATAPIRAAAVGGLILTLTALRPLPDAPATAILVEIGLEAIDAAALLPLPAPPPLAALPLVSVSSAALSSSAILTESALSHPLY